MAAESSPGRKPGVKVPNFFLEPSQRGTESAKPDRCHRGSFAPNGALFGSRGSHPGLTPGAALCRPLNAGSLSAAFPICLFPKFILLCIHRILSCLALFHRCFMTGGRFLLSHVGRMAILTLAAFLELRQLTFDRHDRLVGNSFVVVVTGRATDDRHIRSKTAECAGPGKDRKSTRLNSSH